MADWNRISGIGGGRYTELPVLAVEHLVWDVPLEFMGEFRGGHGILDSDFVRRMWRRDMRLDSCRFIGVAGWSCLRSIEVFNCVSGTRMFLLKVGNENRVKTVEPCVQCDAARTNTPARSDASRPG